MINTKQKVYLSVSKKKKAFESKEIRWQQQLAEELHKPMLMDFTRRRVIVNQIDEIWSADLVDICKIICLRLLMCSVNMVG